MEDLTYIADDNDKRTVGVMNSRFLKEMLLFNKNNDLGLNDYECGCYANYFEIQNRILSNRFTFKDLSIASDFFSDVIFDKKPDIIVHVDEEERYRTIHRMSRRYSITKNFTDDERDLYAFTIYYAFCIRKWDEKNNEETWSFGDFTSVEKIKDLYDWYKKQFPDIFKLEERISDPTKDDYGYSMNNPIEVIWVKTERQYLDSLLDSNGKHIKYERTGCFSVSNLKYPVDMFNIYYTDENGKNAETRFFIYPYGYDNGLDTPKGFKWK